MVPHARRLSRSTSLLLWAALILLCLDDDLSVPIARADIGTGWLISTLGGFISHYLKGDPGSTGATVGRAILNLQEGLTGVGGALKDFAGKLTGWLGGVVGILKAFREHALIPMLKWLREKIVWLKQWLRKFLGPTIDFLLKVRKKLLELYAKYVRPVLDMIDIARFFLKTLNRLGVEWAGALEARLGKIESAITTNFQRILGSLNRLIDVVDSVVTLELLFQRIPFLRTLQRDLLQVSRLLVNSRNIVYEPSPQKGAPSFEQIATNYTEALLTGGGPYAAVIAEMEIVWRRHLNVR